MGGSGGVPANPDADGEPAGRLRNRGRRCRAAGGATSGSPAESVDGEDSGCAQVGSQPGAGMWLMILGVLALGRRRRLG